MSEFKIDFIELAILAEACIPPAPIARACFFSDLSDKYYHLMPQDERNRLFEMISPKLDLTNEDCQHFFARFNPFNQYKVKHTYNGKTDETLAYRFNGKYHVSETKWVEEKYIDTVVSLQELTKPLNNNKKTKEQIFNNCEIKIFNKNSLSIHNKEFIFSYNQPVTVVKEEYKGTYRNFGGLQCGYIKDSPEYEELYNTLLEYSENIIKLLFN